MFTVEMGSLKPVGEFGSREWCETCAQFGVKILDGAGMPADLSWGFSEHYTFPAARLVSDDWPDSGYHFMVKDGVVSGGAGIPDECLALPGFHAKFRWAFLCNQSRTLYGTAGQKAAQRRGGRAGPPDDRVPGF